MQIPQPHLVRVRGARWRVADVRRWDGCQLLTLTGAGPGNEGIQRRFLAPFDLVEPIEPRSRLKLSSRRVWRRACRALIAAETPPGGLHQARLARIDLLPHQLEPALALVRGLGSRVLLADEVGLGKTIQAGLIVSELRARAAADRVLIVTPAGLRDQWARELGDRFALGAAVVDVAALRRAALALPFGANPWQTLPVAVTSIDYVKRPDVLAGAAACPWDVLIVDEAHAVAGHSERHAAVAALAARTPYVVLLTATPHSGDRRAFLSLCALGSTGRDAPGHDRLLVFRRTRQEVQLGTTRHVHRLFVRSSPEELRLHSLLMRYLRAVAVEWRAEGRAEGDFWLAVAVLHKRALSSARSLERSVARRLAALDPDAPKATSQLLLPLDDSTGELTLDDEPPPWPAWLGLHNAGRERELLAGLAAAAARATRRETKIAALRRLLARVQEPAIVFTEYRDTLDHLRRSVAAGALVLHGGMTRAERLATIERFDSGSSRVLLATDAAGEGLNLQAACRIVVNLELPWNPMRLEQRIGRVDRIGQRHTVHAFHLIARDRGEDRILARLRSRVARARRDIGGPDPMGTCLPGDPLEEDTEQATLLRTMLLRPSMQADAAAEARRIANARRLTGRKNDLAPARVPAGPPLIVSARCWRTRLALGREALLLWRVSLEDASGRMAASTLSAVRVRQDRISDWRSELDRLLSAGGAEIRTVVDSAAARWREEAAGVHHRFTIRRLQRERSIARAGHSSPPSPDATRPGEHGIGERQAPTSAVLHPWFQPGLFDLRAERRRLAVKAAEHAAGRDRAERLVSLERSDTLLACEPQLVLALVP